MKKPANRSRMKGRTVWRILHAAMYESFTGENSPPCAIPEVDPAYA